VLAYRELIRVVARSLSSPRLWGFEIDAALERDAREIGRRDSIESLWEICSSWGIEKLTRDLFLEEGRRILAVTRSPVCQHRGRHARHVASRLHPTARRGDCCADRNEFCAPAVARPACSLSAPNGNSRTRASGCSSSPTAP
jgi:hypothetical protein